MTALIIINEEIQNIRKIVKHHEESGLLIKDIIETVKKYLKWLIIINIYLLIVNTEIYQIKLKFNDAHSRNNLPKIKDRANVITVDEYNKSIGNFSQISDM